MYYLPLKEYQLTLTLVFRPSRKHAYIILTPLNPLLYSKTGFLGVYIIFLISA